MSLIKKIGIISKKFLNNIRKSTPNKIVRIYGNVQAPTSSKSMARILQIMET